MSSTPKYSHVVGDIPLQSMKFPYFAGFLTQSQPTKVAAMACTFLCNQAIVVGGGLGGMSAANTVVENGGRVVLLVPGRQLSDHGLIDIMILYIYGYIVAV